MYPEQLKSILVRVQKGELPVDDAMSALANLPFETLDYAKVDHHRALRCGFPEVILCQGKTPAQVSGIIEKLAAAGVNVLATRATVEHFSAVAATGLDVTYDDVSRCIALRQQASRRSQGTIALVCAGTADLPVIEEARVTCDIMDQRTASYYDVGVAGIHRLLAHTEEIRRARVVVVAAGMEGALASVVGGLVEAPVIAVPTSVGYGASFKGLAPLLTMLNGCAPGVSVVNIDNGFGAGYLASIINRMAERASEAHRP